MDKIDEDKRDAIFLNRKKQFESKAGEFKINCYQTSIWENTIYKAWSDILGSIIPKKDKIKELLEKYYKVCQADEVILFEKNFFCIFHLLIIKKLKIMKDLKKFVKK